MTDNHILKPHYNVNELNIGILHFGLGNFHRAHQAVYTEDAIEQYVAKNKTLPNWGIAGISLKTNTAKKILGDQDYLYTVCERNNERQHARQIGCIRDALFAKQDAQKIHTYFINANIHTVTVTVTEKGYCYLLPNRSLDSKHPDIQADWQQWQRQQHEWFDNGNPNSVIGWITLGLGKRYYANQQPFITISCDNLPSNGVVLKNLIIEFANHIDSDFAAWINNNALFCNSMVDRITPKTTEHDFEQFQATYGYTDPALVICEPFKQWVIEAEPGQLPVDWLSAGATIVDDVTPYEIAKLRLLNGCHSALAYIGYLYGSQYIYEAVNNQTLKTFCQALQQQIIPTLESIPDFSFENYAASILERFANTSVKYTTLQVATDGSQKLPQRIVAPLIHCIENNLPYQNLLFVIAAWLRFIYGKDENGNTITVNDPLSEQFTMLAAKYEFKDFIMQALQTANLVSNSPQLVITAELIPICIRLYNQGIANFTGSLIK